MNFAVCTFRWAALAALLLPAPALADTIGIWSGRDAPVQQSAVTLPSDFGRHVSDGLVLQIAVSACGQQASCVQQVWLNQYVTSCRNHIASDTTCYGQTGIVAVAAYSIARASTANQGCPEGSKLQDIPGLASACVPDIIVD